MGYFTEYITYAKPPTVCRVQSCYCDAYITITTDNNEEIGICPACIEEMHTLQASVILPEQRARVITLDVMRKGRTEPLPIDEERERTNQRGVIVDTTLDELAAILAEIESYHGTIQAMEDHLHVRQLHAKARQCIDTLRIQTDMLQRAHDDLLQRYMYTEQEQS